MKTFKFLRKPFNTEDYDMYEFRFLGVSPAFRDGDGRPSRKMIFIFRDGSPVPAQTIHSDHDAFHYADIYEVRGNQVFLIPRRESAEYINVTLTYTRDENI